ncbi:MAG: hypothetical protein LBS56_01945, partial [Propionibacteriaceae bacterium]|nr:hypothetical protein [Propionibacteriaceae bacterium]
PGEFDFTQADLGVVYRYQVWEEPGGLGGVAYDDRVWDLTLEARYDETADELWIATTTSVGDGPKTVHDSRADARPSVPFANSYQAAPGEATPTFSKQLSGRAWLPGESFTFELTPVSPVDAPLPQDTSVTVGSAAEAASFDFGAIEFTTAGTYVYAAAEVVPDPVAPALTYASARAYVTVTVTDPGTGRLATSVAYDSNQNFVNHYQVAYDWDVYLAKTVQGRDLRAGEFTFSFVPQDQASADLVRLPLTGAQFANWLTAADGEPAVMGIWDGGRLTNEHAGNTYCYRVSEVIPADADRQPGVVYDTTTYLDCAQVEDDGLGVLTVTTTLTGSDGSTLTAVHTSDGLSTDPMVQVPFVNEYRPADLTLVATVDNGHTANAHDPTDVTLTAEPASIAGQATVTGDGTADPLGQGTYQEEVVPGLYDLTNSHLPNYNESAWACSGTDFGGEPIAVPVVLGRVDLPAGSSVTCRLAYSPPVPATVTDLPVVAKELRLANGSARPWQPGDTFTMRMCGPAELAATPCREAVFTEADHDPRAFGALEFAWPGTYTYSITEQWATLTGFAYSSAEYMWRVVVTNVDGALVAQPTLTKVRNDDGSELVVPAAAQQALFVNVFDLQVIQGTLSASKRVRDLSYADSRVRTPSHAYDFDFTALGADSPTAPAALFANSQMTVRVRNAAGSESMTSPQITFRPDHVGHTYYYKAVETATPGLENTTWDDHVFFWALEVSAGLYLGDPTVEVSPSRCVTTADLITTQNPWGGCDPAVVAYDESVDPVFVNTYDPNPAKVTLGGTKLLSGRPWDEADSFTFTLSANNAATQAAIDSGAVRLPATLTETVTGAGLGVGRAFVFDEILIDIQGTYQFKITETQPAPGDGLPGVAYDTQTLVYEVVVTNDISETTGDDGQLDAEVEVRRLDEQPTFTNVYSATATFAGVDATKTLAGRALALGEFRFTVSTTDAASCAKAGLGDTCSATVANGADPARPAVARLLDEITFTQEDLGRVYRYDVAEVAGALGGVAYDPTGHTLTLEALYDGDTGELWVLATTSDGESLTRVDSRDGARVDVAFDNVYTAAPATVTPQFAKQLAGRDWLPGDEFTFALTAASPADAPLPPNPTVTVTTAAQAAAFGFGPIQFTAPGTYVYDVAEVTPTDPLPGVAYATRVRHVTVTVTDPGTGALVANAVYDGATTFVNTYATSLTEQVDVTKTLTGRDLAAGEFTVLAVPADQASADRLGLPLAGRSFTTGAAAAGQAARQTVWTGTLTNADAGRTYCAQLSEVVPATPLHGVIYDAAVYRLCVGVVDGGYGVLAATWTLTGPDGIVRTWAHRSDGSGDADVATVPFANVYLPADLTLVATVRNGQTRNTYGPEDVTLSAEPTDVPGQEPLIGDGTADPQGAGTYHEEVVPGRYRLANSPLPNYSETTWTCEGTDLDGEPITVPVDQGHITNVPPGSSVTCRIEYSPPAPVTVTDLPLAAKALQLANGTPQSWHPGDTFTMRLCGPAELEATPCREAVFTAADHAPRAFGELEFTWPGTYTYSLTEAPGSQPGYNYSGAEHIWQVVVVNDGAGSLEVESQTLTQVRADDGTAVSPATPVPQGDFVNTFDAATNQLRLEVEKSVADASMGGALRAPARAYDFEFAFVAASEANAPAAPFDGADQAGAV